MRATAEFPNFEIVYADSEVVRIVDRGPWPEFPTVSARAQLVVNRLVTDGALKPGMRLFFYDETGDFAKIVLGGAYGMQVEDFDYDVD